MGVLANKSQLTAYVSNYLEESIQREPNIFRTPNQKMYLAGGYASGLTPKCVKSTYLMEVDMEVEELSSTQTEANTRMEQATK